MAEFDHQNSGTGRSERFHGFLSVAIVRGAPVGIRCVMSETDDDDLWEMVNLSPAETGLSMTI